jgi:hypothetical protein
LIARVSLLAVSFSVRHANQSDFRNSTRSRLSFSDKSSPRWPS